MNLELGNKRVKWRAGHPLPAEGWVTGFMAQGSSSALDREGGAGAVKPPEWTESSSEAEPGAEAGQGPRQDGTDLQGHMPGPRAA